MVAIAAAPQAFYMAQCANRYIAPGIQVAAGLIEQAPWISFGCPFAEALVSSNNDSWLRTADTLEAIVVTGEGHLILMAHDASRSVKELQFDSGERSGKQVEFRVGVNAGEARSKKRGTKQRKVQH
jgi:hypothetical protein